MNKNIRQKLIIAAALMIAATASAFAQGNGLAGINEATSMVSSYFDPGTKLIYAIGAVVGLIGGVKVYGKEQIRTVRLSICKQERVKEPLSVQQSV